MSRTLEQVARSLASRALFYSASPEALVDAQIGQVLDHLERQRELRTLVVKQLLATECALETLVLPLPGNYLEHDPTLRSEVRDRLLALDAERRRVAVEHERRVQELESQLLQLVSQRTMLRENGGPER